jgi:hypothetical protein
MWIFYLRHKYAFRGQTELKSARQAETILDLIYSQPYQRHQARHPVSTDLPSRQQSLNFPGRNIHVAGDPA